MLPLPSAGFFIGLLVDAMEVGLSRDDRNNPKITAALEYLKSTDGTMHRVKAGKIVGDNHHAEVTRRLAILLTRPRWTPLHLLPVDEVALLLNFSFAQQQGFSARLTDYPNIDGVITRALLRSKIVLLATLLAQCACPLPAAPGLAALRPWEPKTGLGDVLEQLRRQTRPRVGRVALCQQIDLTESSWDRLRRGHVPPQAPFDFVKFTSVVVADEKKRNAFEDGLRRAFVGARLVQGLKDEVRVGPYAEAFWADCAREWERVRQVADSAARRLPSPPRLRELFPVLAEGAGGHWQYVWRDLVAPGDIRYFGLICSFALTLANTPSADYATLSTDAAVLGMFDLIKNRPEFLAKLQEKITSPPRTREPLEAAFASEPEQWLHRLALARLEVNEGDPRRALDLLGDPTLDSRHEYFPMLGEAHLKLGEYREALAAFELALARSDSVPRVCASAAQCCRALGDAKGARRYEKIARNLHEPQLGPAPHNRV